MALPLEFQESFNGVDLIHFQGSYSQFQGRFAIPPGYGNRVGFPEFRFTKNEKLLTTDAFSCLVLVTVTGNDWGLYHGGSFTQDSPYKSMSKWHRTFFDFGAEAGLRRGDKNAVIKLGISLYKNKAQALARRRATTDLLSNVGFKSGEIKTRWNNTFEGIIDVLVDPLQGLVGVRYDRFPQWLINTAQTRRLHVAS